MKCDRGRACVTIFGACVTGDVCDRGRVCVTIFAKIVTQARPLSHILSFNFTTKPYIFTRGIARLWFFLYGGVARETKAAAFRRAAPKTRKIWILSKPLKRGR